MIVSENVVYREGQRVQGVYLGLPFAGRVTHSRYAGAVMKHTVMVDMIETRAPLHKKVGDAIIVSEDPREPFLIEVC